MRIIDIPEYKDKKQLLMLSKDMTVVEAARKMKKLNYGAVIVHDDAKKLCGIFTERDLLMKVAAEDREIKGLILADIMTTNIQTANMNDEIYDCMRRMTEGRFRHLPIINDKGDVTGMISQGDFVAITWQQLLSQLKTRTKTSFFSYTQLWMLAIAGISYVLIMPFMSKF
jgi:CBS domain-containing protein